MKIVYRGAYYYGGFLKEGLEKLGHELFILDLEKDTPINEQIEKLCPSADLVLLEFLSNLFLPKNLSECKFPLAAYFIDSPLNRFWQEPLSHLFDYVFVDQYLSVKEFEVRGAKAMWLPLCVSESELRGGQEKEDIVCFVGTVDQHRLKRKNLLQSIEDTAPLKTYSGIHYTEMQDLFAKSLIVLNENLFDGLTLRVFQGLAAGGLVLTERPSSGSEFFFKEGVNIAYYTADSLTSKIQEIRKNPEKWKKVALAGREECKSKHLSIHRATELLSYIQTKKEFFLPKSTGEEALLYEAKAVYLFHLRFLASYQGVDKICIQNIHNKDIKLRARARWLLALILFKNNQLHQATKILEELLPFFSELEEPDSILLLAFIYVFMDRPDKAMKLLCNALPLVRIWPKNIFSQIKGLSIYTKKDIVKDEDAQGDLSYDILMLISDCYYSIGLDADKGLCSFAPISAFDISSFLLEKYPSSAAIESLIFLSNRAKICQSLLLPFFDSLVTHESIPDRLVSMFINIAFTSYDKERLLRYSKELKKRILKKKAQNK